MDNLTPITNHGAAAFGRLLQQFQDGGNFGLLVEKLSARWQPLENQAHLLIALSIANATGESLNQYGNNVGQPRPVTGVAATDDNAYRVLIYGRIAANVSNGTIPNLLNVMGALQAASVRIYEIPPASITLNYVNGSVTLTCGCIRNILKKAKAPVSLDITQHTYEPFGFAGDLDAYGFGVGQIGESV